MTACCALLVTITVVAPACAAPLKYPGYCFSERTTSDGSRPQRTVQRWDRHGRRVETIDPSGARSQLEYENGHLVRQRSGDSIDEYRYDARGREVLAIHGDVQVQIGYDEAGHETSRRSIDGSMETRTYDTRDHEVEDTHRDANGEIVHQVRHRYDGDRLVEVATSCDRGQRITVWELETRSYDAAGRHVASVKRDCDGAIVDHRLNEYDAQGRLVAVRKLANSGSAVLVETNEYDQRGRLARSTSFDESGAAQQVELWNFDNAGNLLRYERRSIRSGTWVREAFDYDCWRR